MCKRKYVTISLEDLEINPDGVIIEKFNRPLQEDKKPRREEMETNETKVNNQEEKKMNNTPNNPFEGAPKPQSVTETKAPEKSDRPSIGREAGRAFLVGAAWGAGVCLGLSVVSIAVGLLVHSDDTASGDGSSFC